MPIISQSDLDLLKLLAATLLILPATYAAFFLGRSYWRDWQATRKPDLRATLQSGASIDRKLNSLLPLPVFLVTLLGILLQLLSLLLEGIDHFCPGFIQ
ncbi:hypothetical protein [Sneathiella limimaris]|uniref:hypothetical protein n=1 Tax=Sneathiella limimaris TaxID=1964213 RepID=UPI00146E05BE|nr:hypothetical protein [Sneathiella limimaris]